jgi:hypothetical protein
LGIRGARTLKKNDVWQHPESSSSVVVTDYLGGGRDRFAQVEKVPAPGAYKGIGLLQRAGCTTILHAPALSITLRQIAAKKGGQKAALFLSLLRLGST